VDARPIGVFDSGVGGLTVARAIIDQLPNESISYVGDTLNSPYGPKSLSEVRKLALEVMDELVASGVKLLVIACNSASAAVLRDARERYTEGLGVPVVEVIQPAVRTAVATSSSKRVGVIGTSATISSKAYDDAFAAAVDFEIFSAACPAFVDFVERGVTSGPELLKVASDYLAPLKAAQVDTLVLGCTHYPLLQDVFRVLTEENLSAPEGNKPTHNFFATGDAASFQALAGRFLGPEVSAVKHLRRKDLDE
jgi:glutamate racemase